MIKSKLTTKARTTIPQPVRMALKLHPGDELLYEIEGSRVIMAKLGEVGGVKDPVHAFSEWHSAADRRAYADL